MRAPVRRFLFCCALLAVVLPAGATVVMALTIEELTARSPVIVRGTVRRTEVAWDDGHRKIWSWAEVEVQEQLKGTRRKSVLVKQPGGVIAPIGQTVSGAGRFEAGEDVVLFLEPAVDEPDVFVLMALAAGKVKLVAGLGPTVARRDLHGLSFARRGSAGTFGPVADDEVLGTADGFLARVRAAVRGGSR